MTPEQSYYSASSSRPGEPRPLDEDDKPTDFGFGPGSTGSSSPHAGEEGETEIPASRRAAGGGEDFDEEETNFGRPVVDEDVTELEVVATPVLGLLWAKAGMRLGKYYPLKDGTIIGRKDGDLVLDDPKVSSMHAKFTIENDNFVVWDLGSRNGTFVNGQRIREATTLEENDLIKIGDSEFVIKLFEPKPKRKTARRRASAKSAGKSSRREG